MNMIKIYAKAQAALTTFKRDERGVTAIEYALIGVAMAAIVGAVFSADGDLGQALKQGMASIKAAMGEGAPAANNP